MNLHSPILEFPRDSEFHAVNNAPTRFDLVLLFAVLGSTAFTGLAIVGGIDVVNRIASWLGW